MHVQSFMSKPQAFRAALLIVILGLLYYGSYQYRIRHPHGTATTSSTENTISTDFINDWLDVDVISPFNPSPIASYCNRSDWHPNLVFRLDNANGGIGNVRGNILDFLFYAIEAGASIILPDMATRSQPNISNVWAARSPFDVLFDEQWFLQAMEEACPQMAIYKPAKGQKMVDALPGNYQPKSRRVDADKSSTRVAYLEHLDAWLKAKPEFNASGLMFVNLERTLWEIDTRSLPLGLRRAFGQLLRHNPHIRRLAAIVVQNLSLKYGLQINPKLVVPKRAFYGAHLRTEADAQSAGWLNQAHANFSAQTDSYIEQALKHEMKVLYVASGNMTDIERFKAKAAAHRPPLNVTSKLDLLLPSDVEVLERLTGDQQALVDYEVLQRCSVFGGLVKSSFSYNIALTRDHWLEDQGRVLDP